MFKLFSYLHSHSLVSTLEVVVDDPSPFRAKADTFNVSHDNVNYKR